nr:EOG090X0HLW [Eulimnadia texana]
MKFRFCGDQDCPDWFLAEIGILSRLSSVKMKLLSQLVVQELLGKDFNVEKAVQLTSDAKIGEKGLESLLASIRFVLHSGARFSVPEQHLSAELQQVGLPREHTAALVKVYSDSAKAVRQTLIENTLRRNRLDNATYQLVHHEKETWVKLILTVRKDLTARPEIIELMCEPRQLQLLLHQMYRIRQLTEQMALNES